MKSLLALLLLSVNAVYAMPNPINGPDGDAHGSGEPEDFSGPNGFDKEVEFEEHNERPNIPICTTLCDFPMTDLSLVTNNELPVTRFLKDEPGLKFSLNYICPENIVVRKMLPFRRARGLAHLRYRVAPDSNNFTGSFNVHMWGALDAVGNVQYLNFTLAQENCVQPMVSIPFLTTNPNNLVAPNITIPRALMSTNCTADPANSNYTIQATLTPSGEYNIEIPHDNNQNINITVSEIGYDLQDKASGNRKKGRIPVPNTNRTEQMGGFKNITGLPENVSCYSERKDNSTHLRIKMGNEIPVNGTVCLGIQVSDGVSDSTVHYAALTLNSVTSFAMPSASYSITSFALAILGGVLLF